MTPIIVGYGSSGQAPPNTVAACLEAFDFGAGAVAVDVCETSDGQLVCANRRTLRLLGVRGVEPDWAMLRNEDLGRVFGPGVTHHRVVRLATLLDALGSLSVHLMLDDALRPSSWHQLEHIVALRSQGETTVLASADQLADSSLAAHVQRVAIVRGPEDVAQLRASSVSAVATQARSLPLLGRIRMPRVALGCDTRGGLAAAHAAGVVALHTERPAWLRWAWTETPATRMSL